MARPRSGRNNDRGKTEDAVNARMLELIGRECGSIEGFILNVHKMAAAIESMYHVTSSLIADDERASTVDWRSLRVSLEDARQGWPSVYSGLGNILQAKQEIGSQQLQ